MHIRKVLFTVEFTPEEVVSLRTASEHHYDGVCKMFAEHIKPTTVLDWHEFDILAKICESPLAPEDISQAVWKGFAKLRAATESVRQ